MPQKVDLKDALLSLLDSLYEEWGDDLPVELRFPVNLIRKIASRADDGQIKDLRKATKEDIQDVLLQSKLATEYAAKAGVDIAQLAQCTHDVLNSIGTIEGKLDVVLDSLSAETVDAEIDAAKQLLKEFEIEIVLDRLTRLKSRMWCRLPDRQKFRVLANFGHAHNTAGEFEKAAPFFIEARDYQPDEPEAIALAAAGMICVGSRQEAFAQVTEARAKHPNNPVLMEVSIRAAPPDQAAADLELEVSAQLMRNTAVLHALTGRACHDGELDRAMEYARAAIEIEASVDTRLSLANVLIQTEARTGRLVLADASFSDRAGRLGEAITLLTAVVGEFGTRLPSKRATEVFYNRAVAYMFLGQNELAFADLQRCLDRDTQDEQVLKAYSRLLDLQGRRDEAVALLRARFDASPTAGLAIAIGATLVDLPKKDDCRRLIEILEKVPIPEVGSLDDEQVGVLERLVVTHCQLGSLDNAQEVLERHANQMPTALALSLRAHIARIGDEPSRAREFLNEAMTHLSEDDHVATKYMLVEELRAAGDTEGAFAILRDIAPPTMPSRLRYPLIQCAMTLKEYEFIRTFAKAYRDNGYFDLTLFDLELQVLEYLNGTIEAIHEMQSMLDDPPEGAQPDQIRLWLSMAGARLNRPELVTADPALLPSVDDVDVETGRAAVSLLQHFGESAQAIDYAYRLFRRFPSHEEAHVTLIMTAMLAKGTPFTSPTTVGNDVAFCYVDEEGRSEWRIIETDVPPEPDLFRQEISAEDSLAKSGSDAQVGDDILIAGDRKLRVIQILDKRLYRARRCLEEFGSRFPTSQAIRGQRVIDPETGEFDPAPILEELRVHREHVENADRTYATTDCLPVHFFVRVFERTLLESLQHLASQRIRRRTSIGTAVDQARAQRLLSLTPALVVDETTLCTLYLINETRLLEHCPNELVISEGTLANLVGTRDRLFGPHGSAGSTIVYDSGKIAIVEPSEDAIAEAKQRYEAMLARIESTCRVVSGFPLAKHHPDLREEMSLLFGKPAAESLAIAESMNGALWADERTLAQYGDFRRIAPVIPTAYVANFLAKQGVLSEDNYVEMALNQLAMKLEFVPLDVKIVRHAIAKCRDDAGGDEITLLLDELAHEGMSIESVYGISKVFMLSAFELMQPPVADRAIVRAVSALRRRSGGDVVLRRIESELDEMFGLNPIPPMRIRDTLAANTPAVIVLPSPADIFRYGRR
ncbi:MAG: PIN domain-containing protein [Phycisphaerales bacterium]